jgi:hypothetical protein
MITQRCYPQIVREGEHKEKEGETMRPQTLRPYIEYQDFGTPKVNRLLNHWYANRRLPRLAKNARLAMTIWFVN